MLIQRAWFMHAGARFTRTPEAGPGHVLLACLLAACALVVCWLRDITLRFATCRLSIYIYNRCRLAAEDTREPVWPSGKALGW